MPSHAEIHVRYHPAAPARIADRYARTASAVAWDGIEEEERSLGSESRYIKSQVWGLILGREFVFFIRTAFAKIPTRDRKSTSGEAAELAEVAEVADCVIDLH